MHEKGIATPWNDAVWMAERAIVLQVLSSCREVRWSLAELQAEIDDLDPEALRVAFGRLRKEGVIVACGDAVVASRCALHLDTIGMVAI
jgi:hypothetical protein